MKFLLPFTDLKPGSFIDRVVNFENKGYGFDGGLVALFAHGVVELLFGGVGPVGGIGGLMGGDFGGGVVDGGAGVIGDCCCGGDGGIVGCGVCGIATRDGGDNSLSGKRNFLSWQGELRMIGCFFD